MKPLLLTFCSHVFAGPWTDELHGKTCHYRIIPQRDDDTYDAKVQFIDYRHAIVKSGLFLPVEMKCENDYKDQEYCVGMSGVSPIQANFYTDRDTGQQGAFMVYSNISGVLLEFGNDLEMVEDRMRAITNLYRLESCE